MALGLAWLQATDIAVEPVELTVIVGAPVIVQLTGEFHTNPVPASVLFCPAVARVPVKPVQLMLRTVGLAAAHVTVTAPDRAVKNTASAGLGTPAPPGPPSVADQNADVLFQLAVPPTQYLFAIMRPYT